MRAVQVKQQELPIAQVAVLRGSLESNATFRMLHFAAAIDRDGEYRVPRARYLPSLTSEQLFDPIDLPFFLWTSSREDEHQV